jgi:hypothetical protein
MDSSGSELGPVLAAVNMVMNHQFPYKAGSFSTATISFPKINLQQLQIM